METFQVLAIMLAISSVSSAKAQQISTPCTSSMISSFTPCMNFITGSNSDSSSAPTSGCCKSLRSLMSTSMDCACLILTANIPLPLTINRTLAIDLPRACNEGGVPVQCKAVGTPLPAPGPGPFLFSPPPSAESSPTPLASKAVGTPPAPEPDATLAPESPLDEPANGAKNQPSPTSKAYANSPPLALVLLVLVFIFKCF